MTIIQVIGYFSCSYLGSQAVCSRVFRFNIPFTVCLCKGLGKFPSGIGYKVNAVRSGCPASSDTLRIIGIAFLFFSLLVCCQTVIDIISINGVCPARLLQQIAVCIIAVGNRSGYRGLRYKLVPAVVGILCLFAVPML